VVAGGSAPRALHPVETTAARVFIVTSLEDCNLWILRARVMAADRPAQPETAGSARRVASVRSSDKTRDGPRFVTRRPTAFCGMRGSYMCATAPILQIKTS
jgi:hypothetical protein